MGRDPPVENHCSRERHEKKWNSFQFFCPWKKWMLYSQLRLKNIFDISVNCGGKLWIVNFCEKSQKWFYEADGNFLLFFLFNFDTLWNKRPNLQVLNGTFSLNVFFFWILPFLNVDCAIPIERFKSILIWKYRQPSLLTVFTICGPENTG